MKRRRDEDSDSHGDLAVPRGPRGRKELMAEMDETLRALVVIGFIVLWLALQLYILPKLGVPT